MTFTLIGVACLVGALLVVVVPWAYQQTVVRKDVVVNLKGGTALRGVAYKKRGPLLILKSAHLNTGTTWTPVDGEVVIKATDIDFIQVP